MYADDHKDYDNEGDTPFPDEIREGLNQEMLSEEIILSRSTEQQQSPILIPGDKALPELAKPLQAMEIESKESKPPVANRQPINLAKLEALVETLLQKSDLNDQEFQEMENLTDEEKMILANLKEKKSTPQGVANGVVKNTKKREEEIKKLVMKKSFKYLQKRFERERVNRAKRAKKMAKNSGKQQKQKEQLVEEFYNHYFLETSQELDVQMVNFWLPERKYTPRKGTIDLTLVRRSSGGEHGKSSGQKTINNTYIKLVAHSPKFKKDVLIYLNDGFIDEYRAARRQKISKMLLQMAKRLKTSKSPKDYIMTNSKAKIPWSDGELVSARDYIRDLFMSAGAQVD